MKLIVFPMKQLLSMERPESYIQELSDCAVKKNDISMTFDKDSDCYQNLKKKYENYQPTEQDKERAKSACIKFAEKRIPFSMKSVATAAIALTTGTKIIDEERIEKRLDICKQCDYLRQDMKRNFFCGICGCTVASDDKKLLNLAAYEENLPLWGCKNPTNKGGSKWKANGV